MKEIKQPENDGIEHAVFLELVKSNVITQVEARQLSGKWYIHMNLNGQARVLTAKRKNIRRFANPTTLINYAKASGLRQVIFSNLM